MSPAEPAPRGAPRRDRLPRRRRPVRGCGGCSASAPRTRSGTGSAPGVSRRGPVAPQRSMPACGPGGGTRRPSSSPAEVWQRCDDARHRCGRAGWRRATRPSLADDPEPPVVLFHRGDPDVLGGPRVAVIGTRRATGYGRRHAMALGPRPARCRVSRWSPGLALGHRRCGAHRARSRVDGAPPDRSRGWRPRRAVPQTATARWHSRWPNAASCCSEVPPGVPAAPWRFPVRNRIIAAARGRRGRGRVRRRRRFHAHRPRGDGPRPAGARRAGTDRQPRLGGHQRADRGGRAACCAAVEDVLAGDRPRCAARRYRPAVTACGRSPNARGRRCDAAGRGSAGGRCRSSSWRRAPGWGSPRIAAALVQLESDGWVERNGGWIERVARAGQVPGPGGGAA